MLPCLLPVLAVGLVHAHAAEPHACAPLTPAVMDNATVAGLLGHWVYIMGASTYPPHVAEMKELKYATFAFLPGSHDDEFNVTETLRLNETCVVRNASKILIFRHNATLVHVEGQEASMAELIKTDKELLVLKHSKESFLGLSLSARTPNVSKEHLEEFRAHLRCLGFTPEETFVTSPKVGTRGGDGAPRDCVPGWVQAPVPSPQGRLSPGRHGEGRSRLGHHRGVTGVSPHPPRTRSPAPAWGRPPALGSASGGPGEFFSSNGGPTPPSLFCSHVKQE
uniref:Apolipoprotein M n=1 Tax=Anser cygnoides TaxID=8845 RepID=A0A8B9EI40_ANSCY